MRTIETTLYQFDELPTERAKERARDWYREHVFTDSNDWGCVYEDAATVAEILGIDLRRKPVKLMNGSTRYDLAIWFEL